MAYLCPKCKTEKRCGDATVPETEEYYYEQIDESCKLSFRQCPECKKVVAERIYN